MSGLSTHSTALNYDEAASLVSAGPFIVVACVCLIAGFISFASPCIIPLIPGYIAYFVAVSGQLGANSKTDNLKNKKGLLPPLMLFISGYTVIYLLYSVILVQLASRLNRNLNLFGQERALEFVGGVIIIFLGLIFCGFFRKLQFEKRLNINYEKFSIWGGFFLGVTFALSWTPCTGPILSAILTLSLTDNNITLLKVAIYIIIYCIGLGLPFLLLAKGSLRAKRIQSWIVSHSHKIQVTGGVMLIVIGILLVAGWWSQLLDILTSKVILNYQSPF